VHLLKAQDHEAVSVKLLTVQDALKTLQQFGHRAVHRLATTLSWPLMRDDPKLSQLHKADVVVELTRRAAPLSISERSAITKLASRATSRGHRDRNCRCC
jgi:hypothetical protein